MVSRNSAFLASLAASLALVMAFTEKSEAAAACSPAAAQSAPYRVNYFTNYAPTVGGINGSCGKSASGKDACQFFLEDFLSGRTSAVMIAIPQYDCPPDGFKWVRPKGGKKYKVACRSRCPGFYNPDMFGGLYRSEEFELSLRRHGIQASCVPLAADDRYAKSESCKSKIDMVTRHPVSRLSGIINNIRNTNLVPIGRSNNVTPPVRRIERNPQAVAPVGDYSEQPRHSEQARPVPRRGRRNVYVQPEMPSREEDDSQAAASAAAATYYTTYEAQRNKALLEKARQNTEILKQFEAEKKLNQQKNEEKSAPESGVSQ